MAKQAKKISTAKPGGPGTVTIPAAKYDRLIANKAAGSKKGKPAGTRDPSVEQPAADTSAPLEQRREPTPDQQRADEQRTEPAKSSNVPLYFAIAALVVAAVVAVSTLRTPTIDTAALTAAVKAGLPETPPAIDTAAITAAVKAGLPATPPPPPPATTPAKVQAVEVEVMPLSRVKTDTHAHALHARKCLGNEGKKVKVRVSHPTVPDLKGWDWYTCPKKTT